MTRLPDGCHVEHAHSGAVGQVTAFSQVRRQYRVVWAAVGSRKAASGWVDPGDLRLRDPGWAMADREEDDVA
jgi:hypothetical protein